MELIVSTPICRSHSKNASPQGGLSPRNRSPLHGSWNAIYSEENGSGDGAVSGARYLGGAGHSQRSPWSTCGSSSIADGLEDLGDEFANLVSLNRKSLSEFLGVFIFYFMRPCHLYIL